MIDKIKKPKMLDNPRKSFGIDKSTQHFNEKFWNRSKYSTI